MKKRALSLAVSLALCLGLLCGCSSETGPASGPVPDSDPTPSAAPSQQAAPSPTPVDDSVWQDVLRAMPYCGDAARCSMTAEQALAYAQLLADGIAGKVPEGADHDSAAESDVIFWDTPYTVYGYSGAYETDRANVILGDFAGDGSAYLCVISSLTPDCGFDVYYSDGGTARYLYGDDTYGGRAYTTFTLDEAGKMTVSTSGPNGAASHYSAEYGFAGGKTVELYTYSMDYDWETELIHETINGVETVYTPDEWEEKEASQGGGASEESPSAGYHYTPIPLRSMIAYLNQYAAAKGSTDSVTVAERSAQSKMAQAMLSVMNSELSGLNEAEEARLIDLDGDGLKELILFNGQQAWLYVWKNGQLQATDIGAPVGGWVEWWLCEDTATGEKGVEWRVNGGGDFTGGTSTFYYLSHEASISDHCGVDDNGVTRYAVDGSEAAQAEHDAARAKNRRVEELILELGPGTHVGETRNELNGML